MILRLLINILSKYGAQCHVLFTDGQKALDLYDIGYDEKNGTVIITVVNCEPKTYRIGA